MSQLQVSIFTYVCVLLQVHIFTRNYILYLDKQLFKQMELIRIGARVH